MYLTELAQDVIHQRAILAVSKFWFLLPWSYLCN